MAKFYNSTYPEKYSIALDEIISQGGTWEELVTESRKHALRLGCRPYTANQIRAHIKFRQNKDKNYLGKNTITQKGIQYKNKPAKLVTPNLIKPKEVIEENTRPKLQIRKTTLNSEHAKIIITNAIETTKPRWIEYQSSWKNIDVDFILKGYEQQGFQFFKMRPVLEELGILSIDKLGGILLLYPDPAKYTREFAGSLSSPFYLDLKHGNCGEEGMQFYEAVRKFFAEKMGSPGRTFYKLIYYMLNACAFLRQNYSSSFARFIVEKYASFCGNPHFSEKDLLNLSDEEWQTFIIKASPWSELMGIGSNVFDFIIGDIVEAQFVRNSYKFDSANQHFLQATGINGLINPFTRVNTIQFLKSLELSYTLREINKGIYTFCSKTESSNFGYCRNLQFCKQCPVGEICAKNIKH